jgi:hypothetical protein
VRRRGIDREPPRDVFDVRIEAAIFLDHDHGRALSLRRRPHQVTVDLALG